ncbi:hypothetical protein SAMN05428985_104365 [Nocardioides sp. YR527]|uniref:hypothetical protein n=1 Tax=Nocardioides sp. YR527 TaxID=1881028 RepID=UPI00088D45C4|nr:hypothetical protein [Nocardioides sp. YR527]SDK52594.1 hypothetical protein SAMN05428985_104365 [Nocardioides sp. YR527]
MPDHLDTFALTISTGTAPTLMPLGAGSADLTALTTAVLFYDAGDPATAAEVEWATADGTLQHAVLSHDLVSLG